MEGILEIDLTIQDTQSLNELARQLKKIFYSQNGPANDSIEFAIMKIYDELERREDLGPDGGSGHPEPTCSSCGAGVQKPVMQMQGGGRQGGKLATMREIEEAIKNKDKAS